LQIVVAAAVRKRIWTKAPHVQPVAEHPVEHLAGLGLPSPQEQPLVRFRRHVGGCARTVRAAALLQMTEDLSEAGVMCGTTERAELLLPMTKNAPRAARAFVRASECAEHGAQVLEDALLLVSELVSNSVLYGSEPLLLALECQDGRLKVRVRDAARKLPQLRQAAADDERGRGMALVDRLSATWGVDSVVDERGSGKVVWFELQPPEALPA
jgi:anti-sigma regulatory factor (Ser/Thr protein kinase)